MCELTPKQHEQLLRHLAESDLSEADQAIIRGAVEIWRDLVKLSREQGLTVEELGAQLLGASDGAAAAAPDQTPEPAAPRMEPHPPPDGSHS